VGLLGLVGYLWAPASAQMYTYSAYGLVCALALGHRAWRSPPGRTLPWALAAVGIGMWVAGDVLGTLWLPVKGVAAGLVVHGDLLYALGYPVLALAILRFARLRHPERDRGVTLEVLMLLCAAALPVYEFWLEPALAHTAAGTAEVAVTIMYPLLDLALMGAALRAVVGASSWSRSGALLGIALLANVAGDAGYQLQVAHGTYVWPGSLDLTWLLSYLCGAVAALHPSASELADRQPRRAHSLLRQRTVFVGLVLLSPATVVGAAYLAGRDLDQWPVLAATACVGVLLVLRIRGMAREGSTLWRGHSLLFGAGFVVLLMTIAMSQAHSASRERTADARALAKAQSDVTGLAAVEADARTGERPVGQAIRAFDGRVQSLNEALEVVDWGDLQPQAVRVTQRVRAYEALVGRELDLTAAGRSGAAGRLDGRRVEPAHRRLTAAVDQSVDQLRASANAHDRTERIGLVVLFALGAAALLGLLSRLGAVRRAGERAEERVLATMETDRRFRALVAGSADIITLIDEETRVLAYPETVERLLGCEPGTMLGQRINDLLRDVDVLHTAELLKQLKDHAGESVTVDWILTCPDGTRLTAEARIRNHLLDPHLHGYVLNVRDVSERRTLEDELEHRAFHDDLTGLPNRALLEARLRKALSRSARRPARHAVLALDLDDFKSINDSLGQAAGDELLLAISGRLAGSLRDEDTLARLGGDEFAVLLEDVSSADEALEAAKRLIEALRHPFAIAARPVPVTASVGISIADGTQSGSVEEVAMRELSNADLAMHVAKRTGGSSVELFTPEMHVEVTRRVQLREEIQRGLERDEFIPYYQPIIELASRRVVGFEALARWEHPERGLVSPDEFIPAAEQSGLILDLGNSILRQATHELAGWSDTRLYVSVNVAGAQLQREAIADEVAAAIRDAGVAPARLLLEVTETSLIHDSAGNERRLAALRELGVRLAIDDFGTGYSSLSYLQRFSMDVLKIDKSFVDPMGVGYRSPLVEAMITMARALGLEVVAEGIETPGQMFSLIERGCRAGQGYLFSKPLPASEVEAFLSSREPALV
jgi:diguanylate cyclase (GGDEF)-like protein/PAS domain S-box-containing protein